MRGGRHIDKETLEEMLDEKPRDHDCDPRGLLHEFLMPR